MEDIISQCYRTLKEDGHIIWNIGQIPDYDIPSDTSVIMRKVGFHFIKNLTWVKPHEVNQSFGLFIQNPYKSWYIPAARFEFLILMSKTDLKGKRKRYPGHEKDSKKLHKYSNDVWEIKPVQSKSRQDIGHSAPYPEQLIQIALEFFTNKGDWVMDPFMGSGTTAFVANQMGRIYTGCEIHEDALNMSLQRLTKTSLF